MLLVSEGAADVGALRASRTALEGDDRRGAVRVLTERVCSEAMGRAVQEWEIETDLLARVHELSDEVTGYAKKVRLAILEAGFRGCDSVAIVVDEDGFPERRGHLQAGIALARKDALPLAERTAIGLAIRTAEAWLLADEKAINDVLAPSPRAQACGPESLRGAPGSKDHPKVRFRRHVEDASSPCATPYDAVACAASVDVVARVCPEGFGKYREELRRVLPT